MLVTELQDLPEEFITLLPTSCEHCGYSLEISNTLTGLHCSNPRCIDKISHRLVALCKHLDITGVGYSRARQFFEYHRVLNPLFIFEWGTYDPEDFPFYEGSSASLNVEVHNQVSKVLAKKWSLGDYVQLAYLPKLQTSCSLIFEGYNTLEEFYGDISLEMIQERLGISADVSLRAISIYETLLEFEDDLKSWEDLFERSSAVNKIVRVCISDSAGSPYVSKRDFMNKMQDLGEALGIRVEFSPSLTKNCDVLVHAGGRVTNKLKKAQQWGLPVMTGLEFKEGLEESC